MVSSTTSPAPAGTTERVFPAGALRAFQDTGSEEAFRELVRHYFPMIFATALRRADGNRGLAEDAAQLVLIDTARQARRLRPATLGAWLHRHTCFTTSKLIRGERRRQFRESKAAAESPTTAPDCPSSLDDLLLGLPEADRRLLVLRHVDGQSHDDIARLLGLTPAAAKKRSERAMRKLRVLMRGESAADSRLAAWLVPPVAIDAASQADAAATAALAAPDLSPWLSWFSHPVTGAALGSAAALALFAVPLAGVWNAPAMPPVTVRASDPGPTSPTPWKTIPRVLPDYHGPVSPAEAVGRLLEIARIRGLEGDGQRRARALIDELPDGWRHDVMLGLAEKAPPGLASTVWFDATMQVLAERWKPEAPSGDLRQLLPLVRDRYGRRLLAKACADADLPATRALVDAFPEDPTLARTPEAAAWLREDLQIGIMDSIAASGDGKAALDFYLSLPRVQRPDGTTRIAQQTFTGHLRESPGLRRSVMENLDQVPPDDLPHVLMVVEPAAAEIPAAGLSTRARALIDARGVSGPEPSPDNSQLPMDDVLDAWEAAVPADLRLEMATSFAPTHAPTLFALARRLGEENGGAEFDPLRMRLVKDRIHSSTQLPLDDLFAMANRIRSPEDGFEARQILLRACGGVENAGPFLEKHIPKDERALQQVLLFSNFRDYPE